MIKKMIVCLVVLSVVLTFAGCDYPKSWRTTYSAWMKVHPEIKDLSFDEWANLYRHNLLPGQMAKRYDGMATGVAVGVATGMMMSTGRR